MIEKIKVYKFIKDKNGKFSKDTKNTKTNKIEDTEIKESDSFDVLDDYVSYDEIQRRLKAQKKESVINNIFETSIIKSKTLPINRNKFILHQYSFDDKRNKIHQDIQLQLTKIIHNGYLTNHVYYMD